MKMQLRLSHHGMRRAAIRITALIALLGLGSAFIQQASAGCLDLPKATPHKTSWQEYQSDYGSGRFIKADYREEEDWGPQFQHAPIVGLWAFNYTSKGNFMTYGFEDGMAVDAGNVLWFADGNEMTYSGVRNPIVGATCLGIWKRTGEFTYVLNHIGLSWDPTLPSSGPANGKDPAGGPGAPSGPAFIKQHIILARDGQSYTGTFSINQLKADGKTPAGPPILGTIKAVRVNIDTVTQPETP